MVEPVYLEKRTKNYLLACKFLALKQFGWRQGKVKKAWPMNNCLAFFFYTPCRSTCVLQVKSNLRSIGFQTRSICFNLGLFHFFVFGANKKYFWHIQSSLHPPSSLHLHSTCTKWIKSTLVRTDQNYVWNNTPNIQYFILMLSQHFISMLTLWASNHRSLVFLWIHALMPS